MCQWGNLGPRTRSALLLWGCAWVKELLTLPPGYEWSATSPGGKQFIHRSGAHCLAFSDGIEIRKGALTEKGALQLLRMFRNLKGTK